MHYPVLLFALLMSCVPHCSGFVPLPTIQLSKPPSSAIERCLVPDTARGDAIATLSHLGEPELASRRNFLFLPFVLLPFRAQTTVAEGQDAVASLKISLKQGLVPPQGGGSAIYVTVRLAGKMKGLATGRELSPFASIRIPVCPVSVHPS